MILSLRVRIASAAFVIAGVAVASAMPWHALLPTTPQAMTGWSDYDRFCLACHGVRGDGRGPAAPFTREVPRDFTIGDFAWRSTAQGRPPTRDDLRATIAFGVAGTSMPAFDVSLTPARIDALVDVVLGFSPNGSGSAPPLSFFGANVTPTRDVARGLALFTSRGCISCHSSNNYDLASTPLRRPGAALDPRAAIVKTIVTGAGAMPGYGTSLPAGDLDALADYVLSIYKPIAPSTALAPRAIEIDRTLTKIAAGVWPAVDPTDGVVFAQQPIAPQGPPPPALASAAQSLHAHQCARCHPAQYRAWNASLHRNAFSPGFAAQTFDMTPERVANCRRCHAPLAEQATEPALAQQGVQCAGCHVRAWTRHGPDPVSASLAPDPSYPLTTLAIYDRADFCMPCHQQAPRHAVNGRPLLDTYREWLEGPYMPRGVQCQHCHMSNRDHAWKGIHDPDQLRSALQFTATAARTTITVTLRNAGAGHYVPTTPTPAIYVVIDGHRTRIGRRIESTDAGWVEREDTRIAPGATATIVHALATNAKRAKISVEVVPDDYYAALYTSMLAQKLPPERRKLYEQALARATASAYVAFDRVIDL